LLNNEEQKYGETVSLKNEKPNLTVQYFGMFLVANSGCPFVDDFPVTFDYRA
jgi:hypothetical protein